MAGPADRLIEKLSYNNDDEAAFLHHLDLLENLDTHVICLSQQREDIFKYHFLSGELC